MANDLEFTSLSPEELVRHILSVIQADGSIESLVYVARMKDGVITSGWTDLSYTEVIGFFEVGKLQAAKEMW